MTLNDFAQLFPEIANPGKSFFDLLAFGRYKKYPEEEFATSLIDFSLKRNNYAGYENNPAGYLWIVITNKIVKWKGGQSNSKLTLTDNLEEESYDDTPKFELKTSLEKLADFLKYIDSSTLRPGQKELVKIMIDVCKNDHDSYREFMKEVNEKAQNAGFSLENIRKLLERIRLYMRGNDGAKNLLTFIQKSDDVSEEMLDFMLSMLPNSNPGFEAYRFSEQELIKMLWLKDLFTSNGFVFNPNRFPKVYYTNLENYRKQYPKFEDGHEGTPDYLGVYRYGFKGILDIEELLPCTETKEGFIVLFKDRIENFAQTNGLNESDVRFVVLMHELGHWLTHWAFDENGRNWSVGYHLNNKHTHEALAQLIAYWSCDTNAELLRTLIFLTPKGIRNIEISKIIQSGSINDIPIEIENPYGRYWLLKEKNASDILSKVKDLRSFWMILDLKMFEFLISEHKEFNTFMRAKELNSFEVIVNEFIDVDLCEKIFGNYCPNSQLEVISEDINQCILRTNVDILRLLMFPDPDYLKGRRLAERLGLI
jgi:hypothetical protein